MEKITFIHVSKIIDRKSPVLLLPLGLIAIANFLKENKIESEILHLALEKTISPQFNLIDYLKENNRHILCLSLHWHQQSNDVINAIKSIKKEMSSSYVILGGFSASFFAEEILKNFKEVDFIVKGDAEIPLLKLIKSLNSGKKNYGNIPNLLWRSGKKIMKNEQSYVISQKEIDSLKFSNFSFIKNFAKYLKIRINEIESLNAESNPGKNIFYYNCGRGCSANCLFCGGSNLSQKIINNRPTPIFVSHKSVIRELKKNLSYGFNIWHNSFDPYPSSDYYPELFRKIRKEKLKVSLQFESWGLPSEKFIDEFSGTFEPDSLLIISPFCGSESVRRRNRGCFFSNNELIKALRYAYSKNVRIEVCFTAGLAFEKREDVLETLSLINFIKKNFKDIIIMCETIEFEPAAPWFINRKKYGISSSRKTFMDFYKIHKKESNIGYCTEELKEKEINRFVRLLKSKISPIQ